jgi:hypothetical protein
MDARKNLIFYLLGADLKKSSPEGSSASSDNGQLSEVIPRNGEQSESPPPQVSGGSQERQDPEARHWSDQAQLYDLIAQNLPQRISLVPSAEEDQQLHEQVTDLEGVHLSADHHDYGELVIGTSQQFVLTIFNESYLPFALERIEGLPTQEFTLSNPPALPVTLPPKGSQFLTVIFLPLTAGEKHLTFFLAVKNHPQKLFKVSLTGTAVKGYFLPAAGINQHSFSKLIGYAKLGPGKVCPCCHQGEVASEKPRLWMRLVPGSRHFKCWLCGARFLTIGDKGKILFKGGHI